MTTTPEAGPTLVLVGHGMVGQRFLEALAARGLTATHRVVVLCEEPRPAYDRVQLTSYFSGRTPRSCPSPTRPSSPSTASRCTWETPPSASTARPAPSPPAPD